ncbi:MAG: peptidoglycan-binding protein [Eubacteriales bacterium]|nr:peptidoglycan-binding protein [Eubacteriales bacterium]
MRKTPSKKADIVEKIPKGTIIEITPVNDVWCQCTYNEKDGYVMTAYLSFMDVSQFQTLSAGDSGQEVLALKEQLKALYFIDADAELDDVYDSGTETAVRLFQAANGMEETGTASPDLQALIAWGSPKNNLPTKIMTVTISSSCSGYNHVGNSWSKYYSLNDQSASSGSKVEIVLGQSLAIYTKITESDSSPDVGSAKEDVEITQDYFDNGFTITQKVTVKENKGRYSGNKAIWTVTYTFAP